MHEGGQLEHTLPWCLFAQFVENTAPTSELVTKAANGIGGLSELSRRQLPTTPLNMQLM
jgi:hypothetical protein